MELTIRNDSKKENDAFLKKEVQRLESEVEKFKEEIKQNFNEQFEREKISMKEVLNPLNNFIRLLHCNF